MRSVQFIVILLLLVFCAAGSLAAKDLQELLAEAESGNAEAQLELGEMYFSGKGIDRDFQKAAEWYEKAAWQGMAHAAYRLGLIYSNGLGTEKNEKKGQEWFARQVELLKRAVREGDGFAAFRLGLLERDKQKADEWNAKAVELLSRAAVRGDTRAAMELALRYGIGDGVGEDRQKAREWLEKAAAFGNGLAALELGDMYFSGSGVEENERKAEEWYKKARVLLEDAARHGDSEAQGWLDYMNETGRAAEGNGQETMEAPDKSGSVKEDAKRALESLELLREEEGDSRS